MPPAWPGRIWSSGICCGTPCHAAARPRSVRRPRWPATCFGRLMRIPVLLLTCLHRSQPDPPKLLGHFGQVAVQCDFIPSLLSCLAPASSTDQCGLPRQQIVCLPPQERPWLVMSRARESISEFSRPAQHGAAPRNAHVAVPGVDDLHLLKLEGQSE